MLTTGLVLDLASEQVRDAKAILDVGCGTGRLMPTAATRFPSAAVEGVDPAAGMVKQAEALIPAGSRIRFRQAAAEALPFPDGSFDLVFSTMTFHHWADQKKGLAEVRMVLAPDGRWLLADFIPSGLMAALSHALRQKGFLLRSRVDAMLADGGLAAVADRPVRRLAGNIRVLAIEVR